MARPNRKHRPYASARSHSSMESASPDILPTAHSLFNHFWFRSVSTGPALDRNRVLSDGFLCHHSTGSMPDRLLALLFVVGRGLPDIYGLADAFELARNGHALHLVFAISCCSTWTTGVYSMVSSLSYHAWRSSWEGTISWLLHDEKESLAILVHRRRQQLEGWHGDVVALLDTVSREKGFGRTADHLLYLDLCRIRCHPYSIGCQRLSIE